MNHHDELARLEALDALLDYQQADEDGIMVLVSRQAIHEVADDYRAFAAENKQQREVIEELVRIASELTSVENNNTLGGLWSKTHFESALNGDAIYQAELTKTELVRFRKAIALAEQQMRVGQL